MKRISPQRPLSVIADLLNPDFYSIFSNNVECIRVDVACLQHNTEQMARVGFDRD